MTKQEINILNFENELVTSRKKLNDLIYELNSPNSEVTKEIMQTKIDMMTDDLKRMESQLLLLRDSLKEDKIKPPVSTLYPNANLPEKKNTNLEDLFGRNLMGIFASVLIFIGMILFGMVIVPALSDEMKIFCMYLASLTVTITGILFMQKSPANKFFISLTGLGVGALFLSLIMSNVYFHLFGDLLTYILLFFWAVGTIVLSKYERKLSGLDHKIDIFEIIGQLGIMISIILGCMLCSEKNDLLKFLMLTIYHFIAVIAFHLSTAGQVEDDKKISVFCGDFKVQNHVFKVINMIILILTYILYLAKPEHSYAAMSTEEILITFFLALTSIVDLSVAYKKEKKSDFHCTWYHIFISLYALIGVLLILQAGSITLLKVILSYTLCLVLLLLAESQENQYISIARTILFIIALLMLVSIEESAGILYILLATAPLMITGIHIKKNIYLIAGTCSIYLWTFVCSFVYEVTLQTIIAAILCTVLYLFIRSKTEDKTVRSVGYPVILILNAFVFSTYLTDITDHMIYKYHLYEWWSKTKHFDFITAFCIAAVIHICMTKKECFKDHDEKVFARIINTIIMLMGCAAISFNEFPILSILIAVGVFTLNSREILMEQEENSNSGHKKYWVMAYIMFKYTVLLLTILYSIDTPAYIISISLLVFAVLSVIAGFWKRKKGYRLYGLVLSMISIFKLIMLDADTKDEVTGSISFMLCGLLCFAISFIYNKIQKDYFDDSDQ